PVSSADAGRPSTLSGCSRFTQVVPQQRCEDAQVGRHAPNDPASWSGPPSTPGPVRQTPLLQVPAHGMLQPPQCCWLICVNTHSPSQHASALAHGVGQPPPPLLAQPVNANTKSDKHEAKRKEGLDTM